MLSNIAESLKILIFEYFQCLFVWTVAKITSLVIEKTTHNYIFVRSLQKLLLALLLKEPNLVLQSHKICTDFAKHNISIHDGKKWLQFILDLRVHDVPYSCSISSTMFRCSSHVHSKGEFPTLFLSLLPPDHIL